MNLKTLFQPKYFYQNLKKSKGIYVLFLFLFPLILALSHVMQTKNGVISFFESNFLGDIMMFVYPITLSFLLFSFIFQKRKVDFMMSMPLSRKQIFVTNTLTGIFIIVASFVVYSLFILLFSLFGKQILSFPFLGSYFLYSILGYIFIFTVSNLAISLAGNFLTSLVLTILFLFFIPFNSYVYHNFVDSNYKRIVELNAPMIEVQSYTNCENYLGIKDCEQKKKQGIYYTDFNKGTSKTQSVPVQTLVNLVRSPKSISLKSCRKTSLLILLSILLGCFAFQKRKMEDCETSFRSFHIHSLVKSLTLVPVFFTLFLLEVPFEDLWLITLILVAYFFLYDLITRKKMSHFIVTLGYFGLTLLLCLGSSQWIKYRMDSKRIDNNNILEKMTVEDIEGFKLNFYTSNELGLLEGYDIQNIVFKDKKLIETFLSYAYKLSTDEIDYAQSYFFTLLLKNGTYYTGVLNFKSTEKEEFKEMLKNSQELKDYLEIQNHQVLALSAFDEHYKVKDLNIDIDTVKKVLKKKDYDFNNVSTNKYIEMTLYRNNALENIFVPFQSAPVIANEMIKKNNQNVVENLKTEKVEKIVTTGVGDRRTILVDRKNIEKVLSYIKKNTEVDVEKPYIELHLLIDGDDRADCYYTNDLSLLNLFPEVIEG